MAQCFMTGMTSYENQSLADISEDITHWITYSEETKNDINELLSKLKDTAFYSLIPYDYKAMIHEMTSNVLLKQFKLTHLHRAMLICFGK